MESPSCLEIVDDAVEMTALAPRHAASSDARSFRSPRTRSAPARASRATLSGLDVSLTSARTGFPRCASRRQISPPRRPVAPTTRITVTLSRAWSRLGGAGLIPRADTRPPQYPPAGSVRQLPQPTLEEPPLR